jgi:hypothetical protein
MSRRHGKYGQRGTLSPEPHVEGEQDEPDGLVSCVDSDGSRARNLDERIRAA